MDSEEEVFNHLIRSWRGLSVIDRDLVKIARNCLVRLGSGEEVGVNRDVIMLCTTVPTNRKRPRDGLYLTCLHPDWGLVDVEMGDVVLYKQCDVPFRRARDLTFYVITAWGAVTFVTSWLFLDSVIRAFRTPWEIREAILGLFQVGWEHYVWLSRDLLIRPMVNRETG